MNKNNYIDDLIKVDFGLTNLFCQVYGEDERYNFKEFATLRDIKKNFSKLLNTIKKSFVETCKHTDKYHENEIINLIDNEIINLKKLKTLEDIKSSLITFYPRLCFLLIGKIPINNAKKKDNRSSWCLNEYRQIGYKQTRQQKSELFLELLKRKKIDGLKSYEEERGKYLKTKLEGEKMFDWFKRKYPQIYFKIFDKTD